MFRATWTAGSLRFWVFVGMATAVLPLLVSAVLTYALLHRGVMADFEDIARRYRDQLAPTQRLQIDLAEATEPLELYLDDGAAGDVAAYRSLRETIETRFTQLDETLGGDAQARATAAQARVDWNQADGIAREILSRRWTPGAADGVDLARRFDAAIAAAVDRLTAVGTALTRDLSADHADADLSYERAEWITGIAAAIALISIVAGVLIIGRFLRVSVDRLVEGAERFADGDRDHRIEVRVPPELHRVAQEFNHMIMRIRDSEEALADLARRDRLTGLLNRRALEESLGNAFERRHRLSEAVSVLVVDVDHFKRINDEFGHPAGDRVLQQIAATLSTNVRAIDKTFRFGGEEFVVLLNDASRTEALALAERLRAAVAEQPISPGGLPMTVTVSIGLAMAADEVAGDALLAKADAALYLAKQRGRNRVVADGDPA